MERVVDFYMFFGALFSLIISFSQLAQKKKEFIDYVYAISFAGLGLWLLQISLYASGAFPGLCILPFLLVPVAFMVPPVMTLRYVWIMSSRLEFRPVYALLFLPALASFAYVIYFIAGEGGGIDCSMLAARPMSGDEFAALPLKYRTAYSMYTAPKIYLVASMIPVLVRMAVFWKKNRAFRVSMASRSGYIFASLITLSNLISIIGDFHSIGLLKFSMVMANTTMCCLFLVTQRNPDYNRLLRSEARKASYEISRLKTVDVDAVIERLYEVMEHEKAFAYEDLNLKDLADELGVGPHQLSEILNERIKKNFNTFVNEFRVGEAKKLLVEEPDRSVLSIGAAVGFNSNTTFCTVFLKMTGISPGHYRKKHSNGG